MKSARTAWVRWLEHFLVIGLSIMGLMVFANVVLRDVFDSGIALTEEVARFIFVWLTFIGAIVAMKEGLHLGMEALTRHLPKPIRVGSQQRGMKRPRRNHSATFKAKVALAASRGDRTLVELAEQFKAHPNQIGQWRAELLERAAEVFATSVDNCDAGVDVKTLHAKIGQLTLENEWKGLHRRVARAPHRHQHGRQRLRRDNVFVERLRKTIKYEHVYLHAYDSVSETRTKIATYLELYNARRPHGRIDRRTPDEAYFDLPSLEAAA